jgi:hypothetical protein
MSIINNLQNFKADWLDVAFIKIAVFAAALLIAKMWNGVLNLDWYWYVLVWFLAAIKPMVIFFKAMK